MWKEDRNSASEPTNKRGQYTSLWKWDITRCSLLSQHCHLASKGQGLLQLVLSVCTNQDLQSVPQTHFKLNICVGCVWRRKLEKGAPLGIVKDAGFIHYTSSNLNSSGALLTSRAGHRRQRFTPVNADGRIKPLIYYLLAQSRKAEVPLHPSSSLSSGI